MTNIARTLRRPAMLAKTGLSRTTAYQLEKSGNFPKHFMLTPRVAVWVEAELEEWLTARRQIVLPTPKCPVRVKAYAGGAA
jgi:prophage regulatory protein